MNRSRLLDRPTSLRLSSARRLRALALALAAASLLCGRLHAQGDDDPLEGLPPANEGAFEGGRTGTHEDPAVDAPPTQENGSLDVPTGTKPSPLFGALPFTQQLLLFEEFGPQPLPTTFTRGVGFPQPLDFRTTPEPSALDTFLRQVIFPAPERLSNDRDSNPWAAIIQNHVGRALVTPPAEGRPPGEGWAHQRFDEFPPAVWVHTAQTGARSNGGVRDALQMHRYAVGEFGPGGLYHNTTGLPGSEGTTRGIPARFHPNMPVQSPLALWTFDGTFPAKLLMARYGEPVLFRHYNALPLDPSANMGFGLHTLTTHEHNGHNPAESDGFTNAFFFPGQYYDYRWPMVLAGHDTINTSATDPRAGAPDGHGGIRPLRGDFRETMSTHWFHDHMLDFTAQNVYKGNAAMMNFYSSIDRGNEALEDGVNLRFPSGSALDWGNRDYDVNLLVSDKAWDKNGQLCFNIFNKDGFLGDQLLTNFQFKPFFEVRARRYRFRILNGCVSRYFKIALVDQRGRAVPFHMIANDGNVMEHAVAFDGTLGTKAGILPEQAIGERYDIVIDFARFRPGDRLYFVNVLEHADGKAPKQAIPLGDVVSERYHPRVRDNRWRDGDPCVGKFLEFRVREYTGVDRSMNPADFVAGKRTMLPLPTFSAVELSNARQRTFEFGRSSGTDSAPWTVKTDGGSGLNGDPRRVSAAPNLGELSAAGMGHVEIWHLVNGGNGWSHPVHIHFEEGVVLARDGHAPPEWERWARKDMYRVGPFPDSSRTIDVALRFREFAGTYVEHCHNTQHEDSSMLLRWDIERPGQLDFLPAPIPTWDGVEFVDSAALPTARSGERGGSGGSGSGGGGDDSTPHAAELTVSSARYSTSDGWRIEGRLAGTDSRPRVSVRIGSDLAGTVLGSASVDSDGRWSLRVRSGPAPDATDQVSLTAGDVAQLLGVPIQRGG